MVSLAPGSARSAEFGPHYPFSLPLCARAARRHERDRAAGAVDGRRGRFLFRRLRFGSNAGGDRSPAPSYGVARLRRRRDRDGRGGAWSRSLQARLDQRNLGRIIHSRCRYARARRAATSGKTRRLLTNRPCSSFVSQESDSKERLRVSNWIVQGLYNYAVNKTVEL